MIDKKKNKLCHWKKKDPVKVDEEMIMQEINLLKTMRVFKHQILDNLNYIECTTVHLITSTMIDS